MVLSDALARCVETVTVPEVVTRQTCADDEECVIDHLPRCVNILPGSRPSGSSGMTTFSPPCLPTSHTVSHLNFTVTEAQTWRCTRSLSKQQVEAGTRPKLAALTDTCLCRVFGGGVRVDGLGAFFLPEAACADGS